jgi:hypothetical protein
MTVAAPTHPDVQRSHYDRKFEPAIREGFLSVQEAVRRGNRQAYAEELGRRYFLSADLALEVADNRTRLVDILRRTGQIPGHPASRCERRGPARLQLMTLLLGVLVLTGLFSVQQWQRQGEIARSMERVSLSAPGAAPSEDASPASVAALEDTRMSIERDEQGRITMVSARRPADVLAAFCTATRGVTCVTKEIRPSEPRFPGRRLGYLTVTNTSDESRILPIRRDRRSGRWVAGNGLGPIVSTGEDELAGKGGAVGENVLYPCDVLNGSDCVTPAKPVSVPQSD